MLPRIHPDHMQIAFDDHCAPASSLFYWNRAWPVRLPLPISPTNAVEGVLSGGYTHPATTLFCHVDTLLLALFRAMIIAGSVLSSAPTRGLHEKPSGNRVKADLRAITAVPK